MAGGVGAQAAVDSLSRQLRFDLNLLFFDLFEIMISAECENQFSRLSPSSLFFLDCRERVVPPGPPLPGLVRKGSLRGEEEEGEIQQCEERLLFLCDTLSNALSRDTANPTKLAQVCLTLVTSYLLFTFSFQVLGSTFSSVVELMLGQEVQSLLSKLKPGPRLLPAIAALTDLGNILLQTKF